MRKKCSEEREVNWVRKLAQFSYPKANARRDTNICAPSLPACRHHEAVHRALAYLYTLPLLCVCVGVCGLVSVCMCVCVCVCACVRAHIWLQLNQLGSRYEISKYVRFTFKSLKQIFCLFGVYICACIHVLVTTSEL